MNLVHKLERSLSVRPDGLAPASTADASPRQEGAPIDFRQLMTRRPPALVAIHAVEAQPERHRSLDEALELLSDASKALVDLTEQYQILENALAATKEQAQVDLASADEFAQECRQSAEALKYKNEQLGKELATQKQRADLAEQTALSSKLLLERSQKAATEAECLASLFQDKVNAYFGEDEKGTSIIKRVKQLLNRT